MKTIKGLKLILTRMMTIFACLVLLVTFAPLTQHGPVAENGPDNPLSYWSFNECSTTSAPDSAGGHDGVILGATSITGPDGSCALQFDGDDYVYCDTLGLNAPSQLTVEAWVKSSQSSNHQTILSSGQESAPAGTFWIHRLADSDILRFEYHNGSTPWEAVSINGYFTGMDNQWVHVAITADYTTGEVVVYRDGERFPSAGTSFSMGGNPVSPQKDRLWMGSYNGGMLFLNGSLDEVRIYEYLLDPATIAEHAGQVT